MKLLDVTGNSKISKALELAFGGTINYSSIGDSPITQYPNYVNGVVYKFYELDDYTDYKSKAYAFNEAGVFDVNKFDVVKFNQKTIMYSSVMKITETAIHEALHDSELVEGKAINVASVGWVKPTSSSLFQQA